MNLTFITPTIMSNMHLANLFGTDPPLHRLNDQPTESESSYPIRVIKFLIDTSGLEALELAAIMGTALVWPN